MKTFNNSEASWQGIRQLVLGGPAVRASVERRDYGADIRLSNGRSASLWDYAVSGCVIEAAVSWARRNGAMHVSVHG